MPTKHDAPNARLTWRKNELAEALGIGPRMVERLIAAGRLRAVKPGGHVVLITDESVQAMLRDES